MVNNSNQSVTASSVSVVVDLTTGTSTSTANGMDGESRAINSWIYLYLITSDNGQKTRGSLVIIK